jgi:hypothetical protein
MEIPYHGRAVITDSFNGLEIIIPAYRPPVFLLRTFGGLGLAAVFVYYIWAVKAPTLQSLQINGFAIVIFCLLGIGLLFLLYALWWAIAGKEVITVAGGVLTIEKKNAIDKAVSYDLHSATNFRSVEEVMVYDRGRQFYSGYPWQVAVKGTVKFDYGVDTIQFGDMLSQAEGETILERLRAKKLIG